MISRKEPRTDDFTAIKPALEPSAVAPTGRQSAGRNVLDVRLIAWNAFVLAIGPFALALKLRRFLKKRTNHEFSKLRWQVPNLSDGQALTGATHIVLAGASFGEVLLIDRLTKALKAARPDVQVTWAIRDPRTIEQIRHEWPSQRIAVWPYDSLPPVMRWLDDNKPDALVFVERFSFPTLAAAAKNFGARVALVNGRAKSSSARRATAPYYRWLLSNFDVLSFQSESYARRVRQMAPPAVTTVDGNLKLDVPRKTLDPARAAQVEKWLLSEPKLPLLAAGSTNNDEEERFVLEAFLKVRSQTPCRLLLAPRKFERVPDTIRLLQEKGLTYSLRSQSGAPADVMLLDTMGELSHCYQFCEAAYVGGSFNGMGHNVAEPVEWGIPVSYGMRRGHFEDIQKACEKAGIGFRIEGAERLAAHWTQALTDSSFREHVRGASVGLFSTEAGALTQTADRILELLPVQA